MKSIKEGWTKTFVTHCYNSEGYDFKSDQFTVTYDNACKYAFSLSSITLESKLNAFTKTGSEAWTTPVDLPIVVDADLKDTCDAVTCALANSNQDASIKIVDNQYYTSTNTVLGYTDKTQIIKCTQTNAGSLPDITIVYS